MVSILISADFLKIDKLVKECIEYFVVNIEWVKLNFEKFVLGIVFISVLPIIFKAIKRK